MLQRLPKTPEDLFTTTGDISSVQAPHNENVGSLISLYEDNDVQFEVITSLLCYSSAKNINYVVRAEMTNAHSQLPDVPW